MKKHPWLIVNVECDAGHLFRLRFKQLPVKTPTDMGAKCLQRFM